MNKKADATLIDSLLLKVSSIVLAVERRWIGLGLSRKTTALLQATGIVIFSNAFGIVFGLLGRWLGLKPGIDVRPMPTFRGSFLVAEILLLIIAFLFYRSQMRR